MTEEQIEILIAKMLDAPSSLSDEELDSILQDEDLRSFYAASAALGNACIRQPEWDMEAEWHTSVHVYVVNHQWHVGLHGLLPFF